MIVSALQGKKPKMADESLLTSTPGAAPRLIRGIPPPQRGKGTRDGKAATMRNGTGQRINHSHHTYL